jgi:uncharacterized membrane protein
MNSERRCCCVVLFCFVFSRTVSVWTEVMATPGVSNPNYTAAAGTLQLASVDRLALWTAFFARFNPRHVLSDVADREA